MQWRGEYPCRDSNPGTRFRKPLLYPLSYRGKQSTKPYPACRCCGPEPFDTDFDTNAAHIPGQRAAATLSLASF